jgi:3-oxoacyl-[acyl-carrier-protein] synthase-3
MRLIEATFNGDPTRADSVVIEREGYFKQDGRAVRNFSVRQTVRMIREVSFKHNLDFSKDVFIGHQANLTMLRQIADAVGIPDENNWKNVEYCGNQAAAGAVACLSEKWDELKPETRVLIAVLGAGLTWGTALLEVLK